MQEPRAIDATPLAGRQAVVTGAGGALGGAVTQALAERGASVIGVDRTVPTHRIPGVDYRAVDVLDDSSLGAFFDSLDGPWAVANVVGGFAAASPLTALDPDELMTQLRLNLLSAALITKHALRRMTEAGEGRVVHTSSRAAIAPAGSAFAYSVSKLGVLHLVEAAARETHGSSITVNAVVPSIMDTPANRAAMPGADHARWPSVAEVAAVFAYLASPDAAIVSGAAVPVFGRS